MHSKLKTGTRVWLTALLTVGLAACAACGPDVRADGGVRGAIPRTCLPDEVGCNDPADDGGIGGGGDAGTPKPTAPVDFSVTNYSGDEVTRTFVVTITVGGQQVYSSGPMPMEPWSGRTLNSVVRLAPGTPFVFTVSGDVPAGPIIVNGVAGNSGSFCTVLVRGTNAPYCNTRG